MIETMKQREGIGLPAGEPFVRQLLGDPAAIARGETSGYGFPLTERELSVLQSRALATEAVTDAIATYAAGHRDVWAGQYIDQSSASVIVRFTGDLSTHRRALRRVLHADAQFEVMSAECTLAALEELETRVRSEDAWFASVDAQLTSTRVDQVANRMIVDVSGDHPDIATLVSDHFGNPGGMDVIVGRFGPGPWTGGRGDVVIVARDPHGAPVVNLDCVLEPDDEAAWGGDLLVTGDDGLCHFRAVGATGLTVTLRGQVGNEILEFGKGRTTVVAGAIVTLILRVDRTERPD